MNSKTTYFDVIIVGGGLAGLSSAIHLSKAGVNVLVIEKNNYPKHKVCGEYISNEVLPYLDYLGIDVFKLGAQKINTFRLSTAKNQFLEAKLQLGGFGISRYCLDENLARIAIENKAEIINDTVLNITFLNDEFTVETKQSQKFKSKFVIGAYGKRANLDKVLQRTFIKKKSPFLAVKIHVKGDFPTDLVALHNFKGGYCGVSKVENGNINLCYITKYNAFKEYNNIEDFQQNVVYKNVHLKAIFENSEAVFDVPLTISQISFLNKKPVQNHILMSGDSAGMIHPLCGNGMSMAIRSAQMISQLIIEYLESNIKSRAKLEKEYTKLWNREFKNRINTGRLIAYLFNSDIISELLIRMIKPFPQFLQLLIKRTHGKPLIIK